MTPKILLLTVLILFTSCVSEVDFNQSNNLSIQPKYVVALVQFKFNPTIPTGIPIFTLTPIEEKVPVLLDKIAIGSDQLKNATIRIKGLNTFETDIEIEIVFYKDNMVTYTFQPMKISKNATFNLEEIIDENDLNSFISSNEVSVKVIFQPFTPINLEPELNFQISGEFELLIQNK